jgi:chitin disaccharide deacetylase
MKTGQRESQYLIFAADDLGRTKSVNAAVCEAYDRGLLNAASIMAGGEAFLDAAGAAHDRPGLSIGLHVTLCDGMSVSPHSAIPDLTDANGQFRRNPAPVWISLGRRKVLQQAEREIEAQFDMVEAAGLRPSYTDSHHHLHMHPRLFDLLCRIASARGVSWIRIPNEPLRVVCRNRRVASMLMHLLEYAVFGILRSSNRDKAREYGLRYAAQVFGLSHTGCFDEEFVMYLIDSMASSGKPFMNEIFCHPDYSTDAGLKELLTIKSVTIAARLDSFGIKRIGYKDI